MLWQLFAATSNHFSRTLDRDRLHASTEVSLLAQVRSQTRGAKEGEIERFLEGFPRRYLAVHSAAEIAEHFALYQKLKGEPMQTAVTKTRHGFSLSVITADRPALFAKIAGVLAGWGMNIVKADAFANAAGVVLDTFQFVDLHRTLELNPGEIERFRRNLADVVNGKAALEPLLQSRDSAMRAKAPKIAVETRITFDDSSSLHSTLLEIVTQDRPGLLYEMGSSMAKQLKRRSNGVVHRCAVNSLSRYDGIYGEIPRVSPGSEWHATESPASCLRFVGQARAFESTCTSAAHSF
jgi:[protein-PII] uridylyltransferase